MHGHKDGCRQKLLKIVRARELCECGYPGSLSISRAAPCDAAEWCFRLGLDELLSSRKDPGMFKTASTLRRHDYRRSDTLFAIHSKHSGVRPESSDFGSSC
jgi:hypothetical protein